MEMPFGGTTASDTFETGTRAAAWGGTTTIVDFAIQQVGGSLREGLDAWHAKADGNCAIDYALPHDHGRRQRGLAQGDGGARRRGRHQLQAVHGLPGRASTATTARCCAPCRRARRPAALIMMHAENGIAIDVLIEQALARGQTDPRYHGDRPPRAAGGRGDAPGDQARAGRGRARLHRAPLGGEGAGGGREGPRRGLQRLRRDLPAVPVPVHRRPRPARVRGRQVRLLAPRCGPASTRRRCGAGCARTTCRWSPPTTARSASSAQKEMGLRRLLQDPERAAGRRAPDGPAAPGRGRRAHLAAPLDRAGLRDPGPDVRALPAQGHDRARARTRTSSSTTRPRRRCCRRRRTT